MGADRSEQHPVVLFDGVCNLCNASVQLIIDQDPTGIFRFASLQGTEGQRLLREHGLKIEAVPSSVLLIEEGRVFRESTAALRIARRLSWPARMLVVGMLVPRPIRDAIYRVIARNRYRWFGRTAECRRPTAALRQRFLD